MHHDSIGVTWGQGKGDKCLPPHIFFNLGIVFVVTELSNGK
jgi:hypothetical protein